MVISLYPNITNTKPMPESHKTAPVYYSD